MASRTRKTSTKSKTAKTTASVPKASVVKAATSEGKTTSAATEKTATATVVESIKPVVSDTPIKKKELIDRVVAESGMKKKDVKPVVEAMLAVMGRALREGEEIVAPPMGKMMVKRVKDLSNARVMTLRLRSPNHMATPAKPSLAEPAE